MTLDGLQDRIQYRGAWSNGKKTSDAAQTDTGRTGFSDSLSQAQGASEKRADAMGGVKEQDIKPESDTRTLRQKMEDIIAKLNEKVRNGETAPRFQIGAQSFTIEEWDQLIERIDAVQEEMREQQRAKQGERLKEEAQKGIADADWMDNRYAEDGVIQKDENTLTIEEQLERLLLDMDDPDERVRETDEQELNGQEQGKDGQELLQAI